jgi:hypothetical protein
MNRPDDDLRRLFEETRRSDEEKAPPFRRVLERDLSRRPSPGWTVRVLAAAAAAVMVIAVVISARSLHRPQEISQARIETWKAPTDFLLEPSFTELFDSVPTLSNPVPDYSALLTKRKGNKS